MALMQLRWVTYMKLRVNCKSCRKSIPLHSKAKDRFALAEIVGENFEVQCLKCTNISVYHVNDVKAYPSHWFTLLLLFVLTGGPVLIFVFTWEYFLRISNVYVIAILIGLLLVPYFIYEAFNNTVKNKVNYFNVKQYG